MITQSRLKELLSYDPLTGIFIRKIRTSNRVRVGDEAGSLCRDGRTSYKLIMLDRKRYKAHRLAWLYVHGEHPKGHIDHIDGNGLNNRIENLRDANPTQNQRNACKRLDNTSGITGVSFCNRDKKWVAQISTSYGRKRLGNFDSIESAIAARKDAESKHGYHENHGRPL